MNIEGVVYLIHLNRPMSHARHYIGWAANVDARLYHHRKGSGSKFLAAANRLGITYEVVRTWPGGKDLERQLKNQKKSSRLCPICKEIH